MENKERIIQYLIDNKQYLKYLVDPHTKTRNRLLKEQPREFHDDIIFNYDDLVKFIIVNETSKSLALDYETICIILDNTNLEGYIYA